MKETKTRRDGTMYALEARHIEANEYTMRTTARASTRWSFRVSIGLSGGRRI